jgi:hypothetical protein
LDEQEIEETEQYRRLTEQSDVDLSRDPGDFRSQVTALPGHFCAKLRGEAVDLRVQLGAKLDSQRVDSLSISISMARTIARA